MQACTFHLGSEAAPTDSWIGFPFFALKAATDQPSLEGETIP